nr:Wzy polymerase domain-containing protein [Chromobacterium sp. ASV5]
MPRIWPRWLLALAVTLPFFNAWRYQPVGDWGSNASCLLLAGLFMIVTLRRGGRSETTSCPRAFPVLLGLALLWLPSWQYNLPFYSMLLLVLAWLSLQLTQWLDETGGRERLILTLAQAILLAALLQALLGFAQASGLAAHLRGWVIYDAAAPGNVMGNFGQRNQFAQYLGWGMAAACYLFAVGQLNRILLGAALLTLALLMSWSGARLPLAYGLGLCLLAWLWLRRNPDDPQVRRMAAALAIAVGLLAFVQIFNQQIDVMLAALGLPVHLPSGLDRLLDAGFGARRRIEWSKAWLVFQQHPWFGVGAGGYAWHSVWLEAYGGWPKVPESWLFVHCHNLVFQLLAETGIVGTVLALGGLVWCLLPYFHGGRQSADNLLLVSVAMMLLGHSMFEYPLWYLPFLLMLTLICALAPQPGWSLQLGARLRGVLTGLLAALSIAYVASGVPAYWRLAHDFMPGPNALENSRHMVGLAAISRNPLWAWEAESSMVNYLQPSAFQLDLQLELVEKTTRYQPYATPLVRLAILRALNGQPEAAGEALTMAIANYPDYVPVFQRELASYRQPQLRPLQEMARRALNAGAMAGGATDAGRAAAVMTVASPVIRQPIF